MKLIITGATAAALVLIIICLSVFLWHKPEEDSFYKDRDSLDTKIDSQTVIRDSLVIVIDTTEHIINEIHRIYEKHIHDIVVQPYDSDVVFLKRYLAGYTLDSTGIKKAEPDSAAAR